ncbi:hypothetical protein ACFVY9_16155, partial [Streptomyces sp. NPDC059544]
MDKGRFAVPAAVTDWATASGVAALLLVTGLSGPHPAGGRELLGATLLVTGGLALAARRRAPLVVLAVAGLCAVGYLGIGFEVLAVSYLVAVLGGRGPARGPRPPAGASGARARGPPQINKKK